MSIPPVPGLERYVRDPRSLTVLGKALFWDMQVGSDSRTACATCHFHAGADHRVRNQLSWPGSAVSANRTLIPEDYPFQTFANPADNRSTALRDSGQRTGSAGAFRRHFTGVSPEPGGPDLGIDVVDTAGFRVGNLNLRQVTPRNTPSVIDSALDVRTFWDGRASNIFTGRTPFGDADTSANMAVIGENGRLIREPIRLLNSSLASLAVAPPLNTTEMAYAGRTWPAVARKLLPATPLALQKIASDDSILAPFAGRYGNARGFESGRTYLSLIREVFQPAYWSSTEKVEVDMDQYSQPEYNFPVFFALAVQSYLNTLISDDSRFDRLASGDRTALTAEEVAGLLVFQGQAGCLSCHSAPEFTTASHTASAARGSVEEVMTRQAGTFRISFSDTGFVHTGVRPVDEDNGLWGLDDFGLPFSNAARTTALTELAIAGAFKVPRLRNVEFTGPYFHNGGEATLEQVVDFYNRGGDHPDALNLSATIRPLSLSAAERGQLVAFLESLSDDRVRYERAPFDHPELCVPVGYDDPTRRDTRFGFSAADTWAGTPPTGQFGNAAPLQTFDELLRGMGKADHSREHTLADACTMPAITASADPAR